VDAQATAEAITRARRDAEQRAREEALRRQQQSRGKK
jgi:hypothetical protein